MLLSTLENAAHEARTDSVISIEIGTRRLTDLDLNLSSLPAPNIDILDFSAFLVCSVSYEHNAGQRLVKLEDLTMENVFSDEPEDT